MAFESLQQVREFVGGLDVPDARREVVESELLDHFFARLADGASESEALAAFGAPEALRVRFESAEREFEFTQRDAIRDGFRFALAFFVGLVVTNLVKTLLIDGLLALLHADPHRVLWPLWYVTRRYFGWFLWSVDAVVPLVVFCRLRPRHRSGGSAGSVRIERGSTWLFLFVAIGLGFATALCAENLTATLVERIAVGAATWLNDDGVRLDLALWLVTAATALFHLPLRRPADRSGRYIERRGMILP